MAPLPGCAVTTERDDATDGCKVAMARPPWVPGGLQKHLRLLVPAGAAFVACQNSSERVANLPVRHHGVSV